LRATQNKCTGSVVSDLTKTHCARQIVTEFVSRYNFIVEWYSGKIMYVPLDIMAKDDPVLCAEYAKRNGLLDIPGWKRFRHLAKNSKKVE
jgi:hypothetical protein